MGEPDRKDGNNPTVVPFVDLLPQFENIRNEIHQAINRVLDSQRFILGPEVEALECEIAAYCGVESAVAVSSGTDALLLSLLALGIGAGDEVVTTPYSFVATAASIARVGARPIFIDIGSRGFNFDATKLEAAITHKTRAIIPVHLFGHMAEMESVIDIANRHNLYVIEDCAQSIGARYHGKLSGSIGKTGCFSFFPTKNLGGLGDGGMVVSNDPDLVESIRILRHHGTVNGITGGNFRLDALQAAVLRVKLKHLNKWITARRLHATQYRRLLADFGLLGDTNSPHTAADKHDGSTMPTLGIGGAGFVQIPEVVPGIYDTYNQFVIRCARRDKLMSHLEDRGIGVKIYYQTPLHLSAHFAGLGYKPGSLPNSERCAREALSLPMYPEMTKGMVATVVSAMAGFYGHD